MRTGKLLWTFHTVPQAGEQGTETWLKDPQTGVESWKFTGNTGAWGPLTGDEELGYVYIPVEAPSGDTYGGQRPGANLFSDSVVCLDAKTGKRIWYYQLIHHELWDYDIPAAPILLDITVDGKKIKALAQVNKSAFTFVFDRTNGKPVWPIVEKPVPQGNAPGEWYSPTQPFPTKPAAFDRQGVTEADLADYTPEIKAEALKVASQYVLGPIYTPPIVKDAGGKLAHHSAARRGRRSQLDGRRGRSRDRHALRALGHGSLFLVAAAGRLALGDAVHRRGRSGRS